MGHARVQLAVKLLINPVTPARAGGRQPDADKSPTRHEGQSEFGSRTESSTTAHHERGGCTVRPTVRSSLGDLAKHVDVEGLVGDQLLQPGVLRFEFLQPFRVGRFHAAVLGEPAMPPRLGDLEMAAHLVEVLARGQLFVALRELADDLIRRVPPALLGCHGAVILPTLTGIRVAQHLDDYEGLSSRWRRAAYDWRTCPRPASA